MVWLGGEWRAKRLALALKMSITLDHWKEGELHLSLLRMLLVILQKSRNPICRGNRMLSNAQNHPPELSCSNFGKHETFRYSADLF